MECLHPSRYQFFSDAFFERSVLYPLAERVLSIVATSASVERSFSTEGAIHSKARNRLLGDRIEKLKKISYKRRLQAEGKAAKWSFRVTPVVMQCCGGGSGRKRGK